MDIIKNITNTLNQQHKHL